MEEFSLDVTVGSVRGIPVSATAVDVPLLTGPATLMGWSLRDASSDVPVQVEGSVVAPGAGVTIATTAALAGGTYVVNWSVELIGAAAAADANNFEVTDSAGVVLVSLNGGVAANFPQPQVEVTIPQGTTVVVKAVGAGTAGVTYGAQLSLEPLAAGNYLAEIRDGGQPLGEVSSAASGVDSVWFGPMGVRVSNGITLHMINGTLVGVIYAGFDK
jgi:hypothetical protein